MSDESVLRFEDVSFEYGHNKHILDEVCFTVRRGAKLTLMGQNGAGKSTIFQLITGEIQPESGRILRAHNLSIAIARQVIPRDALNDTVREFFERVFPKKVYDIDRRIDEVLEVVHLKGHEKVHDRVMRSFSGGQQARLLLASALIQNPDVLLLDEPTNNLDHIGIDHLREYLQAYTKTVIVISHDADFLNSFTQGVLYLDAHTKKIEQYVGNYSDVLRDISARIERENMKNAQLAKTIQDNKDKANFFAHKGGKMRLVAKKMRERAEEAEEEMVYVRKEDKAIRPFIIPTGETLVGEYLTITSCTRLKNHKPVKMKADVHMRRRTHVLLKGPNGIGKSTLLEKIAGRKEDGVWIAPQARVGYYRQDFSTLDFTDTVYEALSKGVVGYKEEKLRSIAAGFLITADVMKTKVGDLSEGQKGLVAFARLVLERPDVLILDEPTNHINFRHLPRIAEALHAYEGAMILVSHVPEFVAQVRIDQVLDLEK